MSITEQKATATPHRMIHTQGITLMGRNEVRLQAAATSTKHCIRGVRQHGQVFRGLERWLRSKEHFPLLQRIKVQFSTLTWWLTSTCNPSSRDSQQVCTSYAYMNASRAFIYINRSKRKPGNMKMQTSCKWSHRCLVCQLCMITNTDNSKEFPSKLITINLKVFSKVYI